MPPRLEEEKRKKRKKEEKKGTGYFFPSEEKLILPSSIQDAAYFHRRTVYDIKNKVVLHHQDAVTLCPQHRTFEQRTSYSLSAASGESSPG